MDKVIEHEHGRYHPVDYGRPKPDDNWPYRGKPNNGHDRQYGVKSPKFERKIFLRRDQLLFDIDSQISIVAEARRGADGNEDQTLANATTKYQSMFYRWMSQAIGEAKTTMSAFVLEKYQETVMNDLKDADEATISLLMPKWYDDTTFRQLCDKVHEYVVASTLTAFFVLRMTSKDPIAQDMSTQKALLESEIRKLVNMSKPGRISKPFKPF